jgi:hypothetical protein
LPGFYFLAYLLLLVAGFVGDLWNLRKRKGQSTAKISLKYHDPGIWLFILFLRLIEVMMPMPKTQYIILQKQATEALLKFCEDHGHFESYLAILRECLSALESRDATKAFESFKKIPRGPNSFADWYPPVVYPHENVDYVTATFQALVERWDRVMSLSAPVK